MWVRTSILEWILDNLSCTIDVDREHLVDIVIGYNRHLHSIFRIVKTSCNCYRARQRIGPKMAKVITSHLGSFTQFKMFQIYVILYSVIKSHAKIRRILYTSTFRCRDFNLHLFIFLNRNIIPKE